MATDRDQTLALAGVYQAATLTQDLARRGKCDEEVFASSVGSLFTFDAPDTIDVYGSIGGVAAGLRAITERMATQAEITDFELGRYVASLIQLASKLQQNSSMADEVYQRITALEVMARPDAASATLAGSPNPPPKAVDSALWLELAGVYSDTISQMTPQIIVHGEHGFLSDDDIVSKVRTALLTGIRSAWLWRQLGGRKWHLVLHKNRYLNGASALLAESGRSPGL